VKKNTFPPFPKKLMLMVTSRCNLNCLFCEVPQRRYRKKELSKEEVFFIIEKAYQLGVEEIEFTGGEPLMYKYLWEAIEYALSKGLKVDLTTNGLLIKENIEFIKKVPFNGISVSIDGREKTHNYLRGKDCYAEILENIELLQKYGKDVAVNFVVNAQNVDELENVYNYFSSRNILFFFFPVVNQPQMYFRSPEQENVFMKFVRHLRIQRKISPALYRYYLRTADYFYNRLGARRCLGLSREFGVDVEGNIFPCCVWDADYGLGNIFEQDITVSWFGEKFSEVRKRIFFRGCKRCYNTSLADFYRITRLDFLTPQGKSFRKKIAPPKVVQMRLTKRCNLQCRMCDIWKEKDSRKELPVGEWIRITEKIYRWLGTFRLEFAGGEILLYDNFLELVKFCRKKGIKTSLTTNGSLIDEAVAKKIIEAGLDEINISLDTLRADLYRELRGRDDFQKVLKAFKLIKQHRYKDMSPILCMAVIIMEHNLDELLDLVRFVRNGGADAISFQVIDNNFDREYDPLWFKKSEFWVRDTEKIEKIIEKIIDYKKKGYIIANSVEQLKAFQKYFREPQKFSRQYSCSTGENNIIIDTDGSVLLCWNMAPVGNVRDGDVRKIWESNLSMIRRRQIKYCRKTCRILNCNYS